MSGWHAAFEGIVGRLSAENPFKVAFQDDRLIVELYAPVGRDMQTVHDRDEVYLVIAGSGDFLRAGERIALGPGDMLHVPAGLAHRFEDFSPDFRTWAIFYGARQPA